MYLISDAEKDTFLDLMKIILLMNSSTLHVVNIKCNVMFNFPNRFLNYKVIIMSFILKSLSN